MANKQQSINSRKKISEAFDAILVEDLTLQLQRFTLPLAQGSVDIYENEWKELYLSPDHAKLATKACQGNLRASRFRSICWRMLLNILPPNPMEWINSLCYSRKTYNVLKATLMTEPGTSSHPNDNPLSQNDESAWNQHFCDQELKSVIKQDVVRSFPGVDFFRIPHIQETMLNVLFVYAREHPVMCYRQGMHELLAPVLFVLHSDHQALLHTKEQGNVDPMICDILNPEFLEEDAYDLFSRIMEGVECSYRNRNALLSSTGYFSAGLSHSVPSSQNESEVLTLLNSIKSNILAKVDPDLCEHLSQLDISLPLFGIRWLRLLFGRELPLQDLLVLWDVIFAEGNSFDFIQYVVVAMLVAIRSLLLQSDYITCLTYLMKYPSGLDVMHIIDLSLHLKHPELHQPPSKVPIPAQKTNQRSNIPSEQLVSKSVNKPVKPSQPSKAVSYMAIKTNTVPRNKTVVEGFRIQDPQKLKYELDHAHDMMSLCHLKLRHYHDILLKSLPESALSRETKCALEGIGELCTLLEGRSLSPIKPEVEPAFEAGETRPTHLQFAPNTYAQNHQRNMDVQMTVFRKSDSPKSEGLPKKKPQGKA